MSEKPPIKITYFIKGVDFSNINLKEYISKYSGFTRISRLIYILERSEIHHEEALKMLIKELKSTRNVNLYRETVTKFPIEEVDTEWIHSTLSESTSTLDQLETELRAAKRNSLTEEIRIGHLQLGDFYMTQGDFQSSVKFYSRSFEQNTTASHMTEACFRVIHAGLAMGSFGYASSYASRAEESTEDEEELRRVSAVFALSSLTSREFHRASKRLVHIEPGINWKEIVLDKDIAIYGVVTGLSMLSRSELKSNILDNEGFKSYMELVPGLRQCVDAFYESNYLECLNILNNLKPALLLDIFIGKHIEHLYREVRAKAIKQYFTPYFVLDMSRMAEDFGTDVSSLQEEIATLIGDDRLIGKIDAKNKVIYGTRVDIRSQTFHNSLILGDSYKRKLRSLLLLSHLNKTGLKVSKPRKQQRGEEIPIEYLIAQQLMGGFGRF